MSTSKKLESATQPFNRNWLAAGMILAGSLAVILGLLSYYLATVNIIVGLDTSTRLSAPAEATFTIFAFGLFSVFYGIHLVFQHRMTQIRSGEDFQSWFSTLTVVLSSESYNILFVAGAVVYGIIFALFSGTIVYQASSSFSQEFDVGVPSIIVTTCCGTFGQTPSVVLYLSDHLGVLLIPSNILLLVITAWLVGANASLAVYAYRTRIGSSLKWLGSFGALTGLFTACPTCASLVFLGSIGAGGALVAVLVPAQIALVALTDMLLIGNMMLMSKRMASGKACVFKDA